MTEPLKPCPFCGGPARSGERNEHGYPKYGRFWYFVGCDTCEFEFSDREEFYHTDDGRYLLKYPEKECIDRWNNRPASPMRDEDVSGALNTLDRLYKRLPGLNMTSYEENRALYEGLRNWISEQGLLRAKGEK